MEVIIMKTILKAIGKLWDLVGVLLALIILVPILLVLGALGIILHADLIIAAILLLIVIKAVIKIFKKKG